MPQTLDTASEAQQFATTETHLDFAVHASRQQQMPVRGEEANTGDTLCVAAPAKDK